MAEIQIHSISIPVYESSNGDYIYFDGTSKRRYATYQEAIQTMEAVEAGEQPIEIELANTITKRVLPALREVLAELAALQVSWTDNDVQALIDNARATNTNLVGFSPDVWELWGTSFTLFQLFVAAPQEAIGGIPIRKVVMQKYVSAEATG